MSSIEARATDDVRVATASARERAAADGVGLVLTAELPARRDDRETSVRVAEATRWVGPADEAAVDALDRWARSRGGPLPAGWARHLRDPSRFSSGWLASGAFVQLHEPSDVVMITEVWTEDRDDLPWVLCVGSDGGAEHLVLDTRQDDPTVWTLPNVCEGWEDRARQAPDVASFLAAVDGGTFRFGTGTAG